MNTPETDQNIVEIGFDENENPCQFVTAEFARRLERERDGVREILRKVKFSEAMIALAEAQKNLK